MVKQLLGLATLLSRVVLVVEVVAGFSNCASSQSTSSAPVPSAVVVGKPSVNLPVIPPVILMTQNSPSGQSKPWAKIWSKRMNGAISGLSASENGQAILVATSPDSDILGTSNKYLLSLLNSRGHWVWQRTMRSPVKDQAVSADGSFAVISNYSDELQGWSSRGKLLWSTEGVCRPLIINRIQKILCYHDDEAESSVAFDWYDWKGKKTLSFSIRGDVLALKLSRDDKYFAVGLTGGRVLLFSTDSPGQPIWQQSINGEVVDLAVSSQTLPEVAVLSGELTAKKKTKHTDESPRNLTVLDSTGKQLASTSLQLKPIQIEYSSSGIIYYYGNNEDGQFWGSLKKGDLSEVGAAAAGDIKRDSKGCSDGTSGGNSNGNAEPWRLRAPFSSFYNSGIFVPTSFNSDSSTQGNGGGPWVGYEETNSANRTNHLLSYGVQGKLQTDLVLTSDEGAYLYSYRIVKKGTTAVVAIDDGQISVYSDPNSNPKSN